MDEQNTQGGQQPSAQSLPPFNQQNQSELPPPNETTSLPPVTPSNPDENAWAKAMAQPNQAVPQPEPGNNIQLMDDEVKDPIKTMKKVVVVFLVLCLLFLLFWLIFLRGGSDKSSEDKVKEAANQVEQIAAETAQAPDLLNFATRGENEGTYTIYNLSAEGGDRKLSRKLEVSDTPYQVDVEGDMVLFATKGGVYLSENGGKAYKEIISIAILDEITSLKISKDQKRVAYGLLGPENKNTIRAYDIATGKTEDLFVAGDRGVVIHDWNSTLGKIVYSEGCYNCDGFIYKPALRDLNTGSTKQLFNDSKSNILSVEVSEDFKTMLFATSTVDSSLYATGINASGPPYVIHSMNLENASDKTVESFGSKGEKKADGSTYFRNVWVGFTRGAKPKPYFAEGRKVTLIDGDDKKTLFEFSEDLHSLGYVSEQTIIAGLGTDAKWVVSSFSVPDKKSRLLLDGDNNSVFFGVSNK